ncbi:FAD-dependent oxidoreductase [Stackebrandtia soli]|uniref:FAD-dependent oxidoreductase n=1 Tax=Stackebrandtia soli TaxID=1892856 RepID=UPI0039E9A1B2
MSTTPFRVLVVGGGTGGLCLAHGLVRAGIEVAVFERDHHRADGLHGYRVGINADGSRALAECLSAELYDTFVATCARAPRYLNVYTERLTTTASFPLPVPDDPIDSEKSVSRMTLRQVLLTDLDDVIHYGKKFVGYDRLEGERVTARFADGTSETGDLLVGADGTNSAVRRQLLPHATVRDSGVVAIAAKVPVTPETRALIPDEAYQGISMVFAPKGRFCILHSMEFKWDGAGAVKVGVGASDTALIERWPGLLFDNTRDYLNWGLSAAATAFPPDVMRMRGRELIDVALAMTPGWHPKLRRLFELADPGSVFPVAIRTSEPVDSLPPGPVTLLGDAIHTMTPGQGVGANTALMDAADLCRRLVEARDGERTLLDATSAYEAEMLPRGFSRVAESLAQNGTNGDAAIHRPIVGRIVLAFVRGFFRAHHRVPALRRKFVADLLTDRGHDRADRRE